MLSGRSLAANANISLYSYTNIQEAPCQIGNGGVYPISGHGEGEMGGDPLQSHFRDIVGTRGRRICFE
jgi:hypothetical protein